MTSLYLARHTFPATGKAVALRSTLTRQVIQWFSGLFLLLFAVECTSAEPLHLELIPTETSGFIDPVLVEQWESFWVSESGTRLFHIAGNEIDKVIDPPAGDWRSIHYLFLPSRELICAAVDQEYATEFFRRASGRWVFDGLRSTRPVTRLLNTEDGETWAVGDWGELFRRVGEGRWSRETSPSQNHAFDLLKDETGTYWLGTRGDGLFRIRPQLGDTLEIHIPGHERGDIKRLERLDGILYVDVARGTMFRVRGETVERWWPEGISPTARWIGKTADGRGLLFIMPGEVAIWSAGEVQRYEVSYPELHSAVVLSGDRLLLMTTLGELVRAVPARGAVFYDLTSRLRIGGSPDDQSTGAVQVDLGSDGSSELWVLNRGASPHNPLYHLTDGGTYVEITREAGLLDTRGAQQGAFGDLNRDGRSDLVLLDWEGERRTLQWWKNIGRERLKPYFTLDLDSVQYSQPHDMVLFDTDRDGDLDLLLVCYYGSGGERRGGNLLFENRHGGKFELDHDPGALASPGWNHSALPFDFNGDGWLDLFVMNRWIRDRLLLGGPDGWRDGTDEFLQDDTITSTVSGVALDLDRDGDLDLALSRQDHAVEILENRGEGGLVLATETWCPEAENAEWSAGDLKAIDLEGDGWQDLLIAGGGVGESNLLLRGGPEGFTLSGEQIGVCEPQVTSLLVSDMDGDCDPDVYGLRQGTNVVWINQLQTSRHAKLILRGSRSNSTGLHAKWWVWRAGAADQQESLLGFGQVGAEASMVGKVSGRSEVILSLPDGEPVDLTVQFYGGVGVRQVHGIHPGDVVVLHDQPLLARTMALLPGRLISLVERREVRLHFVGLLVAVGMMIAALQIGVRQFQWGVRLVLTLAVLSLSGYWLMLMLTLELSVPWRFAAPPGIVMLVVGVPLMISLSTRGHNRAAREALYDELLQHLLAFAHGAWAASNLDSLKRVGEHLLRSSSVDQRQLEQLSQRVETWHELTRPNLIAVAESARSLNLSPSAVQTLNGSMEELDGLLKTALARNETSGSDERASRLVRASDELRGALREVRGIVYRRYSCDVMSVLRHTLAELAPMIEREGAAVEPLPTAGRVWGLIRAWELADILDNSLVNALRAMHGREQRILAIDLEVMAGHIRLHISDTGCGVPGEDRERIFQEAVSSLGGTGHGLAQARKRLDRYGGNIFLSASEVDVGSTFTIQLNEGQENLEAQSADHRR